MKNQIIKKEQLFIAIIILNFNGKKYNSECLRSVLNQDYNNFRILLVDNKSTDGSVEEVKKEFSEQLDKEKIEIIENDKNFGYAEGNNIGIRYAVNKINADYVVILNNDTVLEYNAVSMMVEIASQGDHIVNPVILNIDGSIDSIGGGIKPSGLFITNKDKDTKITIAGGACYMYSSQLLEKIKIGDNYFDPDFFAYFEEIDMGLRAARLGHFPAIAKDAVIHHYGGASSNSKFKIYWGQRNILLTIFKNYPSKIIIKYFLPILSVQVAQIMKYVLKGYFIIIKSKLDAIFSIFVIGKKRKKVLGLKRVPAVEFEKVFL